MRREDTTVGLIRSNPALAISSPHDWTSKSTGTKDRVSGCAIPSSRSRCRFHAWVPGSETSKYTQCTDEVTASECKGIEPGPEDHILVVPTIDLLRHDVLDESRPRDHGGPLATELLTHERGGPTT